MPAPRRAASESTPSTSTRLGPWKLITPTGWTDWNASCEIIATSLKAIGMDVSTNFPQQAEVTQAVQGGSFDMAVWYVSGVNPATPWARFKDIMSQAEMKPVGTGAFANYGRWKNADVEALLTAASQAADGAARRQPRQTELPCTARDPGLPDHATGPPSSTSTTPATYNFPDEKNTYAPPMFRGAGNAFDRLDQRRSLPELANRSREVGLPRSTALSGQQDHLVPGCAGGSSGSELPATTAHPG